MTNSMTRKGLAVGLSGLLVSSVLGAAPAYAAAALSLTDKNETGKYTMIGGETFTLTGAGNADFVGDAKKLRYKITNVDGVALAAAPTITLDGGASDLVDGANQATKADGSGTDSALGANADDSAVFALAADDAGIDVGADGASIMTSPSSISFTASPADNTTASYKVDFFYDADNDGVLDAGELSSTQTVTFVHSSDVTPQLTIAAATEGDTTVSGTLNFANIDGGQLTLTEIGVYLADGLGNELAHNGADNATTEPLSLDGGDASFVYDSTDGRFEWETAALNTQETGLEVALVKDIQLDVKATFLSGGVPTEANVVGAAVSTLVVANKVGSITADAVVSTTAEAAAGGTADVALNSTYQVAATVKDTATTPAVMAGQAVTATVTVGGAALAADPEVSVTVNGTKYTSAAALPGAAGVDELALTTNADGEAIVTITTSGFANGNTVVVAFTTENKSATVTTDNETLTYSASVDGAVEGLTVVDGSAATINLLVRDQFGGLPVNDKYRIVTDFVSSNQATTNATDATETFADVVNGAATLSITDNGTGAGTNVYDIDLGDVAANGAFQNGVEQFDDFDIKIVTSAISVGQVEFIDTGANVVTQDADTKVYKDTLTAGNNNNGELLLADMSSYDPVRDLGNKSAPDVSSAIGATLVVDAKTLQTANALAAAVPGATVTLSGAGLLFNYTADGGEVYEVDSITVPTNNSGRATVTVWSNNSGTQTVTATSNGVTATIELTSFDAAAVGTATSIVISANDYAPSGSTVIAKAVVTDKYGNLVTIADGAAADFELTYSGPGLAVTKRADATDADGEAEVAYFLGSNDSGTITITAKYDFDDDGNYTDDEDITVTKTITIGSPEASSWTKKLDAGSAKIYAKNIVGAGKVQFMLNGEEIAWVRATSAADSKLRTANGASYLVRTVDLVEGQKNVLEVYVDGVRTTRTAYSY